LITQLLSFGIKSNDIVLQNKDHLYLDSVVRVVPNKRLVCKALLNNQEIYVKLFFGDQARKYFLRDLAGVNLLLKNNIPTPSIIYSGYTEKENVEDRILQQVKTAAFSENYIKLWSAPAFFEGGKESFKDVSFTNGFEPSLIRFLSNVFSV
jgi:hypothetical protein